jgi:hypothetical protein
MHMPLTPEANLKGELDTNAFVVAQIWYSLDKLLGLDVGHTVHTGDTITMSRLVDGLTADGGSSVALCRHIN